MKNKLLLSGLLLLLSIMFVGCTNNNSTQRNTAENQEAIQQISDYSSKAEEFTHALFVDKLSKEQISDYEIVSSQNGFITSDPPIYIVAYEYTYKSTNHIYGYKLTQTESGSFMVLDEGEEIGSFILQ